MYFLFIFLNLIHLNFLFSFTGAQPFLSQGLHARPGDGIRIASRKLSASISGQVNWLGSEILHICCSEIPRTENFYFQSKQEQNHMEREMHEEGEISNLNGFTRNPIVFLVQ